MENKLASSKYAIKIARKLELSNPDWENFDLNMENFIAANLPRNSGEIVGLIGEAYINLFVNILTTESTGRVSRPAIEHGTQTQNYKFHKRGHRIIPIQIEPSKQIVTDYDEITKIDDEIYIWESKLNYYSNNRGSIRSTLDPERIARIVHPLQELFNLPVGMFMVIDQDMRRKMVDSQRSFRNSGGIIVNFPIPHWKVKEAAIDYCDRFKIPLDPNMVSEEFYGL
jgi:hypothetical protein